MHTAAQVNHLTIKFGSDTVIDNVSLDIPARQITVLIGRSGSGKTTFLRAFNRLNNEFSDCVTEGQILLNIDGSEQTDTLIDINSLPLSNLRLQAGMVFQTPNVLPVTIWRNIAMPLEKLTSLTKADIHQRIELCLKDVGLWSEVQDRLQHPASTLSGGQQQRLCLARTLALEPKILLLDEPTASLDIVAAQEIENLLIELAKKQTILMSSHSLSQAKRLAQRLYLFDNGFVTQQIDRPQKMKESELASLLEIL